MIDKIDIVDLTVIIGLVVACKESEVPLMALYRLTYCIQSPPVTPK